MAGRQIVKLRDGRLVDYQAAKAAVVAIGQARRSRAVRIRQLSTQEAYLDACETLAVAPLKMTTRHGLCRFCGQSYTRVYAPYPPLPLTFPMKFCGGPECVPKYKVEHAAHMVGATRERRVRFAALGMNIHGAEGSKALANARKRSSITASKNLAQRIKDHPELEAHRLKIVARRKHVAITVENNAKHYARVKAKAAREKARSNA